MTTTTPTIHTTAMLAALRVSMWSGHRYDRGVSDKVNTDHEAQNNASRVNKHLFAGVASHRAILELGRRARSEHYEQTLAWGDFGERLLPTANFFTYSERMRAIAEQFDAAVHAFVEEYPTLKATAQTRLGRLYRPDDFPDTVRDLFRFRIEFAPIATGSDIRIDLPAEHVAAIEAQVAERIEASTREALRDAWDRLGSAVERVARATMDGGVVRESLIDHAASVCDLLGRLNVTGDPALDRMRGQVQEMITGLTPSAIRSDEAIRNETYRKAAAIMDTMRGLYPGGTR